MMREIKIVVCCIVSAALVLTGLSMAQGARNGNRGSGSAAVSTLSAAEEAGLLKMREEEKLAHDIYLKMYELYGMRIFSNIMVSEQRHMDAIKNLLDRYSLDDPAAGNEVGGFADVEIQEFYTKLLAKGQTSLMDALEVGVQIEELDIGDLKAVIKGTDNPDIETVYTNLFTGSLNHLNAFTYQLESLATGS